MISSLRKMLEMLDRRDRRRAAILFSLIVLSGIAEAASIGAMLPFISILVAPDQAVNNAWIGRGFEFLGLESFREQALVAGIGLVSLFVAKNLFLVGVVYYQNRFLFEKYADYSSDVLKEYMYRPYLFHTMTNTATMMRNVNSETNLLVTGLMMPSLSIFSDIIAIVFLLGFLIILEPTMTLAAAVFFGTSSALFYAIIRNRIRIFGLARQHAGREMTKALNQALGGVKEIKVSGREEVFVKPFRDIQNELSRINVSLNLWTALPRYYNESILIAAVLGIIGYFVLFDNRPFADVIPILAVFGAAAFRIMPGANRILTQLAKLRFSIPALDVVYRDLVTEKAIIAPNPEARAPFEKAIELRNVSLQYPGSETPSLSNISLSIPKGSRVAFVGHSGAGKSSIVDIILGLVEPTSGGVWIDETPLKSLVRAWQNRIGYFPQTIYLLDDTIRRNVAYGLPEDQIDNALVTQALKLANLETFVAGLPDGVNTMVGERAVRVSGGERQRIGIARALYNDPDVLVFDEATASIDTVTERGITDALAQIDADRTMIFIAHRLSTVKACECLFLVENGQITASGTYDELIGKSTSFRRMATELAA